MIGALVVKQHKQKEKKNSKDMKMNENNMVKLVGNICGDIRILKKTDKTEDSAEDSISKIEIIFIPNDYWDLKGKPNSLRIHAYGELADNIYNELGNGDRVEFIGHLRRITIKNFDPQDDAAVKYSMDVVIDSYKLLRKRGSTPVSSSSMTDDEDSEES